MKLTRRTFMKVAGGVAAVSIPMRNALAFTSLKPAVEVDNPLPKPLAITTFWVPNVLLSCDYLITVAPLRVFNGRGSLSIMNSILMNPKTYQYRRDELVKELFFF